MLTSLRRAQAAVAENRATERRWMSDGDAHLVSSDANQSWIIGVASVVFDIDQGQTLEHLYPAGIINEEEGRDVAFNSKSTKTRCMPLVDSDLKELHQL